MKYAFYLLPIAATCSASEIRIVGGKEVNITPVVEWFQTHKGERPMKHWVRLMVSEVKGHAMGGEICGAKLDDGRVVELVLLNAPPEISRFIKTQAVMNATTNAQAQTIEAAKSRQHTLNAQHEVALYAGTDAQWAQTGVYRAQGKHQLNQMEQQAALTKSVTALHEAKRTEETAAYAMFTGKMVGKWQIWDCGIVKESTALAKQP